MTEHFGEFPVEIFVQSPGEQACVSDPMDRKSVVLSPFGTFSKTFSTEFIFPFRAWRRGRTAPIKERKRNWAKHSPSTTFSFPSFFAFRNSKVSKTQFWRSYQKWAGDTFERWIPCFFLDRPNKPFLLQSSSSSVSSSFPLFSGSRAKRRRRRKELINRSTDSNHERRRRRPTHQTELISLFIFVFFRVDFFQWENTWCEGRRLGTSCSWEGGREEGGTLRGLFFGVEWIKRPFHMMRGGGSCVRKARDSPSSFPQNKH